MEPNEDFAHFKQRLSDDSQHLNKQCAKNRINNQKIQFSTLFLDDKAMLGVNAKIFHAAD